MVTGKFGPKQFVAASGRVLPYGDLSISGSLRTAEEESSGKKPATTVKGPGLRKVSLTLYLHSALGMDLQEEIEGWAALAEAGTPYPLVLCGRAVSLHKMRLTSCKVGSVQFGVVGRAARMVAAELALEFAEYLPPGQQLGAAVSSGGSAGGGSAGLAVANPYQAPSGAEKAGLKRTNPGMEGMT